MEKLAKETGTQPSELMALYNAESGGIDPGAKNKSGATGIFQLMFGGKFGDKRYEYTREEFANLSRAEQVKIHRKYLEEHRFFEKGGSGITDVSMANIASLQNLVKMKMNLSIVILLKNMNKIKI